MFQRGTRNVKARRRSMPAHICVITVVEFFCDEASASAGALQHLEENQGCHFFNKGSSMGGIPMLDWISRQRLCTFIPFRCPNRP